MLKTKEEIIEWLKEMEVTLDNVVINNNLIVDVKFNLNLDNKNLTEIPIQFGVVSGNLNVSNNKLTSLSFVKEVHFAILANNNNIHSLENFPIANGGIVLNHNQLTSLKGLPKEVQGGLIIHHNQLQTLEFCPQIIGGSLNCSSNPLVSLEYLPNSIHWDMVCKNLSLNIFEENFDKLNLVGEMMLDTSQDKEQVFKQYVDKDNEKMIKIPLEEIKRYQFKQKLEKNLDSQLNLAKPKL